MPCMTFVSTAMVASWSRTGAMTFDELDTRLRVYETAHDH